MKLGIKDFISVAKHKLFSPKIISNHIKVETSAECNARCDWCWMFMSEKKPKGMMELLNFKKFVDLNKTYYTQRHFK